MKNNKIILGSIEDSLTKNIISKPLKNQIFNLSYIKNYDFICFTSDEKSENKSDNLMNSMQNENIEVLNNNNNNFCKLSIWDKNLNEICFYSLDKLNETCHTFQILDLYGDSDKKKESVDEIVSLKALELNNDTDQLSNNHEINQAKRKLSSENKNESYSSDFNHNNNLNPLIFILGTSIYDKIDEDPKHGHIIILEFTKFYRFNKLFEIEINYPIYKLSYIDNYLITASDSTILAYKFNLRNKKTQEIIDFSNEIQKNNFKNQFYELNSYSENFSIDFKEIRKCNEFNFIYDFICDKDFLLISDINKSVALYKFNREKENFNELCRDSNPIFCISSTKSSHNIYTVCDFNSNIYKLRRDFYLKDNSEKHKFDKISAINISEKVLKQRRIKRKLNSYEKTIFYPQKPNEMKIFNIFNEKIDQDTIYQTFYVTNEGSIGTMLGIGKELFDFFSVLEKELLIKLETNTFEYEQFRSIKDNFIITKHKGFVDGNILQEYIKMEEKDQKSFLKRISYPAKKHFRETRKLIELFLSYH